MAYLEPERVEMPAGVRRVLSDAHARLGGAAGGTKEVLLLRGGMVPWQQSVLMLDRAGRMVNPAAPLTRMTHALKAAQTRLVFGAALRQARMAGQPLHALCRPAGDHQPWAVDACSLEAHVWRLEGLAWQQQRQQRPPPPPPPRWQARGVWERRGGAGRRGRGRREPGVAFELGAWGEACGAAAHEVAAWLLGLASMPL